MAGALLGLGGCGDDGEPKASGDGATSLSTISAGSTGDTVGSATGTGDGTQTGGGTGPGTASSGPALDSGDTMGVSFDVGQIPDGPSWAEWRARYLAARAKLPPELIYQLSSDTLTNFLDGTLESGKWTDATVFFGGVTASADVPQAIARIVNQYIAEHVALHDRPISELTVACAPTLAPWGIGFENDRAVVLTETPEKGEILRQQFEAAMARKRR